MQAFKEEDEMKNFKQWLLAMMAAFMLIGVTTACSGTDTDDTETEETENTDDEAENTNEENEETEE